MKPSPPAPLSPVLPVGADPDHSPAVQQAARLLQAGELVVFATETVYGLGARADQAAAVERIYKVKGRPSTNPLIVHVPDHREAQRWAAQWPPAAQQLADRFWPGPLTLVVPADERLPGVVRAGRPTVALRVPSHPVAQALLRASHVPLAAPSANRSGHISPTCAEHVLRSLKNPVALILDSGPTPIGVESTVVDVTTPTPRLLRPGAITLADLSDCIGLVESYTPENKPVGKQESFPSPGLMRRHYAPAAKVCLFDVEEWPVVLDQMEQHKAKNERVGVLVRTTHPPAGVCTVRLADDPSQYATKLYGALHELEEAGCTWLAIEAPPEKPAWHAVLDRLTRAAAD